MFFKERPEGYQAKLNSVVEIYYEMPPESNM